MQPQDVLTLIYTSGTTGPPKGVQLTHDNLIAAVRGYDEMIDFPPDGRVISWPPMAHIAERACSHYLPMLLGFVDHLVAPTRARSSPTCPRCIPPGSSPCRASGEAGRPSRPGIAAEQDEARKQVFQWALGVGLRKVRLEQAGEEVPDELREEYTKADELVPSKFRERLGLDQVQSVNGAPRPHRPR